MKSTLKRRVLALALVIPMVMAVACKKDSSEKSKDSKKKAEYEVDISQCVNVSAKGFDGMGVVTCEADSKGISKTLKQAMKDIFGEDVKSETKKAFTNLENSIRFQAVPSSDVKNGDEVEIKILFDEKLADDCNVAITPSSFKFTVSGLTEIESVNAFEGFQVTFSGAEHDAQIILDNTGCSDFVKNYVVFSLDESTIQTIKNGDKIIVKNGDSVTVTAKFGENFPSDMSEVYVLSQATKSFTAAGLEMYPTSIDQLDVTEIVKLVNEQGKGFLSNEIYNEMEYYPVINGAKFDHSGINEPKLVISDFSVIPEKMYYMQPKANTDGTSGIVILFHFNFHVSGYLFPMKWNDPPATEEQTVDTYVAAGCFQFTTDDTQSTLISTGNLGMVGDSDDETYLYNDHTFEAGYNTFIAPFSENYVVNEMDLSAYASVLTDS